MQATIDCELSDKGAVADSVDDDSGSQVSIGYVLNATESRADGCESGGDQRDAESDSDYDSEVS